MNATTSPQGYYTYRTRNYDGSYNHFTVLVEVLGEVGSCSYRVRLLQPLVGYHIGELMTVRRHNVSLQTPQVRQVDNSNAWWHNL